ncbi:MAG: hypothetical protein LBG81_06505 [Coriobacteriaceae bacterium]|jgi:FKBP-type peptidyl-prolyl cis-trans isomerase (trigger factor)|nr:hypothetical protein [Coriobacteriaceae bacterium]
MAKFGLEVIRLEQDGESCRLSITVPASVTGDIYHGASFARALQEGIEVEGLDATALHEALVEKIGESSLQGHLDAYIMGAMAPFAVAESGLETIMDPAVVSKESLVPNVPFTFEATVVLKPRFSLSSYGPVTVTLEKPQVTEAEIDIQIAGLVERYGGAPLEGIDDAWVAKYVSIVETVADLREMMREQGVAFKNEEIEEAKHFLTASELAKRLEGSIPDEVYAFAQKETIKTLRGQIEEKGWSMKEFMETQKVPEQQFSMQAMLETRERLRQNFALEALARHLGLELTPEDIDEALSRIAPGQEEQARKDFESSGRRHLLEEAALRDKANKWLVETAHYEYRE